MHNGLLCSLWHLPRPGGIRGEGSVANTVQWYRRLFLFGKWFFFHHVQTFTYISQKCHENWTFSNIFSGLRCMMGHLAPVDWIVSKRISTGFHQYCDILPSTSTGCQMKRSVAFDVEDVQQFALEEIQSMTNTDSKPRKTIQSDQVEQKNVVLKKDNSVQIVF